MEKIVQVFNAGETDVFTPGSKSMLLGVLTSKGRIFVQAIVNGDDGRPQGVWMEMPHPDFKSISLKKK